MWVKVAKHVLFLQRLSTEANAKGYSMMTDEPISCVKDLPAGPHAICRLANVSTPMRDGIPLVSDVYLPHASPDTGVQQAWPVIIERTPYGKREASASETSVSRLAAKLPPLSRPEIAAAFASHGYAVVVQDVRGRGQSAGVFEKYVHEANDGYDMARWLLEQPWCNGQIGMTGFSYSAHTQLAAACAKAPGLACLFLDSGGFANAYQAGVRQGGAFELKQLTWAFKHARLGLEAENNPSMQQALNAQDLHAWFERMPWLEGHSPLAANPSYEKYVFDQWRKGRFNAYWQNPALWAEGHYAHCTHLPIMLISSWYDPYASTASRNFKGLIEQGAKNVWLLLGPWTHGARACTHAGEVDFGQNALFEGAIAPSYFDFRLAWFERWLKPAAALSTERQNPLECMPAVRYFLMGGGSGRKTLHSRLDHGGEWHRAKHWPPPQAQLSTYYLQRNLSLSSQLANTQSSWIEYRYDPSNPTPTIGGAMSSGEPIMHAGAFDQRERAGLTGCKHPNHPLTARADVLAFETPPLKTELRIAGSVTARLWVSSNCSDTDFSAKLVDVYPPNADYPLGFAMNLCHGILRMRYREGGKAPSLITPHEVYAIRIALFPIANRFFPGHRLRLEISSSNYPHFDINPNSGEPDGEGRAWRIAQNRIWLDATRPSQLLLYALP